MNGKHSANAAIAIVRRKRGAQLGNANALKHGYYAESFRQMESDQLSSNLKGNFEDEIALLRVLTKRAMDKMSEQADITLEEYLSALRTVAFASAIMERLQRSHLVARVAPLERE